MRTCSYWILRPLKKTDSSESKETQPCCDIPSDRRERRNLQQCIDYRLGAADQHRRGMVGQRKRLESRREVHKAAVAVWRWGKSRHLDEATLADQVGRSPRTMRRWSRSWNEMRMEVQPRGRPPDRPGRERRSEILAYIVKQGPGTGLPALRLQFPEVARGELIETQRRFRKVWKKRRSLLLHVLQWEKPGTVWAMDHGHSPLPMDGEYGSFLAVRDLAAQHQLAAMPVPAQTARMTLAVLNGFVKVYGAPLVIKSDNGPGFRSEAMKYWAKRHDILMLYSPGRTPDYNGAIEAGIGNLKVRTEHQAITNGRPGTWTCDDLQAAVMQGNELNKPWGMHGPSPNAVWPQRQPITPEERNAFLDSYWRYHDEERRHREHPVDVALDHWEQSSIDRFAIRQALVEGGYLTFRRKRIAPPFSSKNADIFS